MSRVDRPRMRCDRCKAETEDIKEMGSYSRISHSSIGGTEDWDLCPKCWMEFYQVFITYSKVAVPVDLTRMIHILVAEHKLSTTKTTEILASMANAGMIDPLPPYEGSTDGNAD